MGPFVGAVAITLCIIVLAGAPTGIPWSAFWKNPEFWQTWLPAWLQGLGTVGAAYVAWRAFSTWREQDAERRRAIVAEQVLRGAHAAVKTIRDARMPYLPGGMEGQLKVMALTGYSERISKLGALQASLLADREMVWHYELGDGVSAGLTGIAFTAYTLEKSFNAIDGLRKLGNFAEDDDELFRMDFELFFRGYKPAEDGGHDDDTDKGLAEDMEKVAEGLGRVIAGK